MPRFRITNPETGETLTVSGETPPSQEDADAIFQERKAAEPPQPSLAGQSDLLGGGGGEPYTEAGGRAALTVAPILAAPLIAGTTLAGQAGQGAIAGGTALMLGQSPGAAATEAGLTMLGIRHGPKLLQLIRVLRGAAPAVAEAVSEGIPIGTRAAKAAETAREIEASRAAARRALMGAKEAAPVVAKSAQAAPVVAQEAAGATNVAKPAIEAATTVAKRMPATLDQPALMRFGKEAVAKNPKLGEKIWVLLDESGAPVKILTPDQAGAAKRAGESTTWIKNIFGK